jgi:hypothetical protein
MLAFVEKREGLLEFCWRELGTDHLDAQDYAPLICSVYIQRSLVLVPIPVDDQIDICTLSLWIRTVSLKRVKERYRRTNWSDILDVLVR